VQWEFDITKRIDGVPTINAGAAAGALTLTIDAASPLAAVG